MAKNKKARGTKTMYVFVPHIIFISILYIFIIVSTVYLNKFTNLISVNTQDTADCVTIINEFQAQSSKLCLNGSAKLVILRQIYYLCAIELTIVGR